MARDFKNLGGRPWFAAVLAAGLAAALLAVRAAPAPRPLEPPLPTDSLTGKQLFEGTCAACHGMDGRGAPEAMVGFDIPRPDFTDCSFATREPDLDWLAVAHCGGPARGFSEYMPAFEQTISDEDLKKIMSHIRSFCANDSWPRGELNLPRPHVTEKAYPEDEAVLATSIDIENEGAVVNELVFEKRFGARNQIEVVVPFGVRQQVDGDWTSGNLGDVAVGVKRAVYHSLTRGTIFSIAGEVILPTGDRHAGFGSGTVKVEPFASFGQLLPAGAFIHAQAGAELPFNRDRATEEAFLRGVLGKSFTQGRWGRMWSPMLEVLGSRDLIEGAEYHWDAVPQVQVTLNARQHVMLNVGVRLPLENRQRDAQVVIYLLWDWFDGGLLEGW